VQREAEWKEKSEASKRRSTSLVASHIGDRSVEEWRDACIEDFMSRRPASGEAAAVAVPVRSSAAVAGRSGASVPTRSRVVPERMELPPLPGLPPLPDGCAQKRGRRMRMKPGFEGLLDSSFAARSTELDEHKTLDERLAAR
jgi:hypothetical protein